MSDCHLRVWHFQHLYFKKLLDLICLNRLVNFHVFCAETKPEAPYRLWNLHLEKLGDIWALKENTEWLNQRALQSDGVEERNAQDELNQKRTRFVCDTAIVTGG